MEGEDGHWGLSIRIELSTSHIFKGVVVLFKKKTILVGSKMILKEKKKIYVLNLELMWWRR